MASSYIDRLKNFRLIRKIVYVIVGMITYPGLMLFNKLKISGTENIEKLPRKNVLFVSNHQTYFADVIAFLHIFCAVKWRKKNKLGVPYYLLNPFTNVFFVSAEETMKKNFMGRFFALAGAVMVRRTWNSDSKEVRRGLDASDTRKITNALANSWVITFPQGTTKPYAPGRKGTAFIIKKNKPTVIPVVIDGFWRAFDKKGIRLQKKGVQLSVTFKPPMQIDYEAPTEIILAQIMDAIEQSKEFMPTGDHHWETQEA
ncbi:MAG: 1-acyl-sn-glycerol-3-phosphate acyltransferase [Bacteroidetes bacterium]|nr:1-acyl-sn-glycerol-3-phosphate acyltransferase [Bacteroidota bacterium]